MSRRQAAAPIKSRVDFARAFPVSRETLDRLETYESLLKTWQRTINLVAPSTLDDVWGRHFADSAQLLALAPPQAKRWLDLGSGAGFPGLVLAIVLADRDVARMTLIESDSRKAAFLREVARQTGVAVDILCERIEKLPTQAKVVSRETAESGKWDVITARALAPLPRLLDLAAPYFSQDTVGLFLKGREAEAEVAAAQSGCSFSFELHQSLTDTDAQVIMVRALQAKTGG